MAARVADPSIVIFACEWYPLTAADNAGEDGCQYGPSTTIVPVECGGCVTGAAILRAFASGAEGVLVAVCGTGDCHYANGNESCEAVVRDAQELMKLSGIAPERLRIDLSSDVEGGRFASLVTDFASQLAKLDAGGRRRRRSSARSKPRARTKSTRGRGPSKPAKARAGARGRSRKKTRSSRRAGSARKRASAKGRGAK